MRSLGASSLALSSITTEALWRQSGRYSANSELLRIKDRRDSGFLLSPTHEEEITSLVAGAIHSYKELPLRLYQIGRKYRDERRPRQGLLRAKEFLMKDLYTFDYSQEHALKTYSEVRQAYNNLFGELKIPYLVAEADSGNMGGKLSHEYHFVSAKGEDNVWSCDSCSYVANEELVEKRGSKTQTDANQPPLVFTGISPDRTTTIKIHVPRPADTPIDETPSWDHIGSFVNLHAVKNAGVEVDTGIESSTLLSLLPKTTTTIDVHDRSISNNSNEFAYDLTITKPGDDCPRCESGHLSVRKAIEVGHTFHLGTRYSNPLQALVAVPSSNTKEPIQMGCHGIGVSRVLGAIASLLSDSKGLNWPRVIAPFEVIVVATPHATPEDCSSVYDRLEGDGSRMDVVLDDRAEKSVAWKLRDADLIGYPVIVVLGRGWKEKGLVEVQCRQLEVNKNVPIEELRTEVTSLLAKL